jgi:hypothetical protein
LHLERQRKCSINVLAAGPALGGEDTTGSKLPQEHLVETGGVQGVPEQTVRQVGAGTSGARPCTTVLCFAVPTTSDKHISSIPFRYCPMITGGVIDQDAYPSPLICSSPSPCPMIAPPTPASLGDGANQRSHSARFENREGSIALIDNTPPRGYEYVPRTVFYGVCDVHEHHVELHLPTAEQKQGDKGSTASASVNGLARHRSVTCARRPPPLNSNPTTTTEYQTRANNERIAGATGGSGVGDGQALARHDA